MPLPYLPPCSTDAGTPPPFPPSFQVDLQYSQAKQPPLQPSSAKAGKVASGGAADPFGGSSLPTSPTRGATAAAAAANPLKAVEPTFAAILQSSLQVGGGNGLRVHEKACSRRSSYSQ